MDYGKSNTSDDVFESPTSGGSGKKVRPEDTASIPITKGGMGFGFTIADSAHGQKVKKILDRPRCKVRKKTNQIILTKTIVICQITYWILK